MLGGLKLLGLAALATALLPVVVFALRFLAAGWAFARGHRRRSPGGSLLEASTLRRRVGVFDCDVNLHVTNARYLSLVDVGRFELLGRLGFFPLLRQGYRSLIGTTCLRFRRELPLFARYELRSRLLGWDDKWIYAEHHFKLGGRAAVVVLAKFLVIDAERRQLAPREALERMAGSEAVPDPPELPECVAVLLRDSDVLMSPD